jgi:hypothetical protein
MRIVTGVRLVNVFDHTLIFDFFSSYPTMPNSPNVVRSYDPRTGADFFTLQGSTASALVSHVLSGAVCFKTQEERVHCALTLVWQQRHGGAGGVYKPLQDPKAPTVLPGQLELFD